MTKFLQKIIQNRGFWPIVIVLLLGFLAGRILLTPGYFNMHDDLQMMRQLEMEKCFKDFQIPCRWVPDMGYGYGFPLFNYYPPLPYLVGQGIRVLGFSFVTTVKFTFFLSFVLSGVAMYFLAKEFWGRLGGVLSAAFYIWAPYHSVDVYVRGAMNEAWALVWFPLILWSGYKLITSPGVKLFHPKGVNLNWVIILLLSWTALLLSHNIMVMIFTPLFAVWCLFWLWRLTAWSKIPHLIISGIWALGLAAFFSLPVILEQKLVQIDTLTKGYYEYVAHFATLNQLFISRFWGYGASVWEESDGMPFPIGQLHWGLAIVTAALLIFAFLKKKKDINLLVISGIFLSSGLFAAFMAHVRSTPIWLTLPFLAIVQFPWRFLTLVILCFSFVVGVIVPILNSLSVEKKAKGNKPWTLLITLALIIGVVLVNKDFFRPERMGPLTDEEKFSAAAWELQQTAGIYDYLPKDAKIAPQGPRTQALEFLEGEGVIRSSETKEGTNWLKTKIDVASDKATLRVNIFNFPTWRAFIDGKEVEVELHEKDELGRIHIGVPQGEHKIELRLFNTPIRTIANIISLLSWLALFLILWKKRFRPVKIRP